MSKSPIVQHVFAIYDVKADAFNTPFFFPAVGMAVRAFKDLANDRNTTVGMHPEDFKLVSLGDFDIHSGILTSHAQVSMGFAADYVSLPPNVMPIGVKKEA